MKHYIYYILAFVGILTVCSCSDSLLDTKPLDKFAASEVWDDANLAEAFIYGTYSTVITDYISTAENGKPGETIDDYSDDIVTSNGNKVIRDQIDKFYDAGWDKFSEIRQCNTIIDNITTSKGIKDSKKPSLIAQARMLRAMIYYKQARLFGKYVIIDHVLTSDEDLKLPRSETIKDTYDFILADLDYAAENLPETGVTGELTKGAALALETEVAIHGAAYIESGSEDYYQKAVTAGQKLLDMKMYSLDSNYADMFNNYSNGISSNENILIYQQSSEVTQAKNTRTVTWVPTIDATLSYDWCIPTLVEHEQGWCKRWPSSELVDDYLVLDRDNVARKWDETSYYQNYISNGGYVSEAFYAHRDKRFYASIVSDSTSYFSNLATIREKGNMHYTSSRKHSTHMTKTGYYCRKGLYEDQAYMFNMSTPYHIIIFRLGRAILNYAEAELRLGNTSEAIKLINMTRTSHGGLPALEEDISDEEALKYYKIERHAELFYEGDRYWSLLRWAKSEGKNNIPELDKSLQCINISADGKSFEMIPLPLINAQNIHSFSERRFLFPVPEAERLLNNNLDQNPLW